MKSNRYLAGLFAVTVLLAACTDKSLSPIFYTLENERSLADDRGLPDEATVHKVVEAGAGTRYFAAANTLYTRTDVSDWTPVSPPVAGALCNTIEFFGVNLYAGFFAKDGTGLGLYRTDPDTIAWDNAAFDADVQNKQIGLIKAVGGNLYVVTAEQNGADIDYYLYESADGTSYTGNDITFDAVSPINLPITDVEDQAGNLWIIAGPYLYLGSPAAVLQNAVDDPVGSGGHSLGGLLYYAGLTQLYVSGKDGKLWMRDGGGWNPSFTVPEIDGDEVRFTRFVDVTVPSGDVLVGTEGTGYFELVGGDQTNTVRRPAYNLSALYNGAINSFFLDTVPVVDVLFACTTGAGLWRAEYIAGDWLWVQE